MKQDRDEPIRAFGARLRGQAGVCKFTIQCTRCEAEVNYTDEIIRDVLTRGIADSDIQLDLLGDKKQDMSLEEVFQFVEAKESGKHSASKLLDTQSSNVYAVAYTSEYKKSNKVQLTGPKQTNTVCGYCGETGHGQRAPAKERKHTCKAYGYRCSLCHKDHHFESVC